LAVIVPAEKLPEPSRATMVFTVSRFVAALAAMVARATLAALCPPTVLTIVLIWPPVTLPVNDPEKLVAVVAVVALPLNVAVIVPAAKLPELSRATMVAPPRLLRLVAVVAEFATKLPAVSCANFEFPICAIPEMSPSTISDVVKLPVRPLCTTPAVVNPSMVTLPPEDIFIRSKPAVLKDNELATGAKRPAPVLPKLSAGVPAEPTGNCNGPDKVPPVSGKFPLAIPVTVPVRGPEKVVVAVMVEPVKLPVLSRTTRYKGVATVLAMVAKLAFVIVPAVISLFTISELVRAPAVLL
jgi:hypothetical protein